MAAEMPGPDQERLSEEQLRAAYEQEMKRVRVEHVLLDNVVTIINLGMRRTGLMPGTEDERDLAQVQLAIESVRALLPQLEQVTPREVVAIREAISQLQLAFVQARGGIAAPGGAQTPAPGPAGPGEPGPGDPGSPGPGGPGTPGPAQRSGRLWVPGQ
ncbi:MAG: hypothetical protein M0T77_10760 [Actinomycetota bacterium]|nr:hypothetical protein [Actinomycetota bacterium]